jgi:hypothetical protein
MKGVPHMEFTDRLQGSWQRAKDRWAGIRLVIERLRSDDRHERSMRCVSYG